MNTLDNRETMINCFFASMDKSIEQIRNAIFEKNISERRINSWIECSVKTLENISFPDIRKTQYVDRLTALKNKNAMQTL